MQAVTLDTILNLGGDHNPKTAIFGEYLQDASLSLVSKAFHAANVQAIAQAGRRIALDDKISGSSMQERAARICGEEELEATTTRLFEETTARIQEIPLQPNDRRKIALTTCLEKVRQIYQRWMQENQPAARERHAERFVVYLDEIKRLLAELPQELNPAPVGEQQEDPYRQLLETGKKFIVAESLAERFKTAGSSFSALHASQKNSVEFSQPQRERFSQLEPRTFAAERFRKAEEIVLDAEFEREISLSQLWSQVRGIVNAGPPVSAPAADIRAWISDEQNRAALGNVTSLGLREMGSCPPEIGELHALHTLTFQQGTLSTLPSELENLTQLKLLQLHDQQFREIPEVISRLPDLWFFYLSQNPEFRTLPEELIPPCFDHGMLTGRAIADAAIFTRTLIPIIGGPLLPPDRYEQLRDLYYFGARDQLTDVPFRLWFRDRFNIPNVPLMLAAPLYLASRWERQEIQPWINHLQAISPFLSIPLEMLECLLIQLPSLAICLALILLSLPIFLANGIILQLIIEPLVTEIRDALGYGRMIHLRDLPEQEAGA